MYVRMYVGGRKKEAPQHTEKGRKGMGVTSEGEKRSERKIIHTSQRDSHNSFALLSSTLERL
jgi:hypothetical protein